MTIGRPRTAVCGSSSGYARHIIDRTEVCAPCREAHRVYQRNRVQQGTPARAAWKLEELQVLLREAWNQAGGVPGRAVPRFLLSLKELEATRRYEGRLALRALRQDRLLIEAIERPIRERQEELARLIASQEQDLRRGTRRQRRRAGEGGLSLETPVTLRSGSISTHGDFVSGPSWWGNAEECLAQDTAERLLMVPRDHPAAGLVEAVAAGSAGSLTEGERALLASAYTDAQTVLLRARAHAPVSVSVGAGGGGLKRGRGRGRHGPSSHGVGQKRFENREQVAADRALREARRAS